MDRFEVRDKILEQLLKDIGSTIRAACPPGIGFALLMFDFGPGGNLFYTSNAERQDIVKAMREWIEKTAEN